MSWSVNGTGPVQAVAAQIEKQISSIALSDVGEMETVKLVGGLLKQALGTFDPEKIVSVQAAGSMGYKDWVTKSGAYQQFDIKVTAVHFSV
jgi:hypothetical protein